MKTKLGRRAIPGEHSSLFGVLRATPLGFRTRRISIGSSPSPLLDRFSGSISGTNSQEAPMMNDASTPTGQPAAVTPPGKLAYATPTTAPLVAGRRSFCKYRDLGVTAASSGKIRAQVTIGAEGMTQPTGWHYHVCEGQFVYMLSGWVDLEFEDGQKLRI